MAREKQNVAALAGELVSEAQSGRFRPVYLLMGDEPFYPDMVCDAVMRNAVDEDAKDFDQFVFFGADADADKVITAARGYSMFGGRVLVVVKEAQQMKDLEQLSLYCANPLESTVLVILMHRASADKRKSLYKSVQKVGVVLESPAVRDYEIVRWIMDYYSGRGLRIAPEAAQLLAESAGTDLGAIAVETDKLVKALPEGTSDITVADIEKNVGISRQYSVFELTRELSSRNAAKAIPMAERISSSAKFAMPMAVSALYTHFSRILKYGALLNGNPRPTQDEKTRVLGVAPYFFREYDAAVRNWPLRSCMGVMSLLAEYDFKGKGGGVSSDTPAGDIFIELIAKILNQ